MKNRVPANPGRVLITPEYGSAAFYAILTRADNPTEKGDPLSKETLLKDSTAALYGLDATAVPDEVLVAARSLISTAQSTADSRSKIETGSYIGTGTYDSDSPCILTLQFAPSLIIISSNAPFVANDPSCGIFVGGTTGYWVMTWTDPSHGSSSSAFVSQGTVDITDKTVSWYASSAKLQLNASGITYKYVAFG